MLKLNANGATSDRFAWKDAVEISSPLSSSSASSPPPSWSKQMSDL